MSPTIQTTISPDPAHARQSAALLQQHNDEYRRRSTELQVLQHLVQRDMVFHYCYQRGVRDERVLAAMISTPRHLFVPASLRHLAYGDFPLPIGHQQTIAQPYIVAVMSQALKTQPSDTVLEIGTGSGYHAAVLSQLVKRVFTVERKAALVTRARKILSVYSNVTVTGGDGSLGLEAAGPFDRIVVTAGAPAVPEALRAQLKPGGCIVIPVQSGAEQAIERWSISKRGQWSRELVLNEVRFVPLIGQQGWPIS